MPRRWRIRRLPEVLCRSLDRDERVLAAAALDDVPNGHLLAATRFGLWFVTGDHAERIGWHHVSRARWSGGVLYLTVADEVGRWPDGTMLLRDRSEVAFRPRRSSRLTDVVHGRVRASVTASRHVDAESGGGWVVLRRIAGRNGLTVQLRLDAGAQATAAGFAEAVARAVAEMWPADTPREEGSGESVD